MEEVSLYTFMTRSPSLADIVFPREAERIIMSKDIQKSMSFDDKDNEGDNKRAADFFVSYMKEIDERVEGKMCTVTVGL